MATWEIMLGVEAISAGISLGAVLMFMFHKEEVTEDTAAMDYESGMNHMLHA